MKKLRGFTLIEVMVTVIVVGILAGLAIPQYHKMIEKSRGTEAKEILLKCYAGYQRLVVDGETIGGGNPLNWRRMGMTDPNAESNRYFNYAPLDNWNSPYAFRAEIIGDSSRWLRVDLNTGIITTSSHYQ